MVGGQQDLQIRVHVLEDTQDGMCPMLFPLFYDTDEFWSGGLRGRYHLLRIAFQPCSLTFKSRPSLGPRQDWPAPI